MAAKNRGVGKTVGCSDCVIKSATVTATAAIPYLRATRTTRWRTLFEVSILISARNKEFALQSTPIIERIGGLEIPSETHSFRSNGQFGDLQAPVIAKTSIAIDESRQY
jgi:hypothetical protein